MKELQGKTCFVTGGTRGIGRATALVLAEHGADIVFNYHQSADLADEVCERAKELGVRAKGYRANIANEAEVREMIVTVQHEFGPISVLVNNAGITRDKSFLKMTRMM